MTLGTEVTTRRRPDSRREQIDRRHRGHRDRTVSLDVKAASSARNTHKSNSREIIVFMLALPDQHLNAHGKMSVRQEGGKA
jgi:hypothetical protein